MLVVAGVAVVVTVKVPAAPVVKVVLLALVKVGGRPRFNVNGWVALLPKPLLAVSVQT